MPSALPVELELSAPGNPETISGETGNSAKGNAARLMGSQVTVLYKQVCERLHSRVGK